MKLRFSVVEFNERPLAMFDGEPQPRAGLLSELLEEVRTGDSRERLLREIEKATGGGEVPAGFTYNGIDVDIHPDRVVIEELYPPSGDADDAQSTELTIEEAKQLLSDWQKALDEWHAARAV